MEALISKRNVDTLAVFVVTFDTVGGNMIEWCLPSDMDLQGVEYKAIPSGSHTVVEDFVYFRHSTYYGVAAFHRMAVQSDIERGARMKSVGILSTTFYSLHKCLPFLEKQVQLQLRNPGNYTELQEMFNQLKAIIPSSGDSRNSVYPSSVFLQLSNMLAPTVSSVQSPEFAVESFIRYFGADIFVLWKLMVLRKRILFFSPPPIGTVCYRVLCCSLLLSGCEDAGRQVKSTPLFYVNVADIPLLESEVNYVGCTTERVFESKTSLFDVYVSNNCISANRPDSELFLRANSADHARLSLLQRAIFNDTANEESSVTKLANFFNSYNKKVFQMLYDAANSVDGSLDGQGMKNVGLDPWQDKAFVSGIAEAYGFDVALTLEPPPCCTLDYCAALTTR